MNARYATQWTGMVAQVRLFGEHGPRATLVAEHGMVASLMPTMPTSSLMNVALADDAPASVTPDLATVGRVNDLAYGSAEPKLAPAIAALPDSVLTYGARHEHEIASVRQTLQRLLLDARARALQTASLQASAAGQPVRERLGFAFVGSVHLYEERLS